VSLIEGDGKPESVMLTPCKGWQGPPPLQDGMMEKLPGPNPPWMSQVGPGTQPVGLKGAELISSHEYCTGGSTTEAASEGTVHRAPTSARLANLKT
jgi:hypothetical protein